MKNKFALTTLLIFHISTLFAQFSLQKLQVNYQTTPLGTDEAVPQFSWQMQNGTNKRGLSQKAYKIMVTDEQNQIVWDSKKVVSDISHAIQYEGKALQATTRYTWKLSVWDNFGKTANTSSWFETGLNNGEWLMVNGKIENKFITNSQSQITDTQSPTWIGGGDADINFYSHYLSVFTLQYNIQLRDNSQKAAFIFGANDSRLSNQYLNFMGVERKKDESYIALELDISGLSTDTTSRAKLNIYRVGYTKTDKFDVPFKSLDIPQSLINNANKNEKHTFVTECNFGVFEFFIDGASEAHKIQDKSMTPTSRFAPRGLNLNPVGVGNNFISFPMLADIGFQTKENQEALFSDIKVRNLRTPSNPIFAENLHGKLFTDIPQEKEAYLVKSNTFRVANPSRNATPMLRSVFSTTSKTIRKARLYVTARGIYEVYLNGKRVSDEFFNPGLTQYNKHHSYQTYDVTNELKSGQPNAIGAWLSEGWWSGNITYSGENWNWFGDRQSLLAKMIITYTDGTEQIVASNDKDWKLYTNGPIRVGSFFQGEVYDANKENAIKDWTLASYDDSAWKKAVNVPLEGTAIVGNATYSRYNAALPYNDFKLVGNLGDKITIVKNLTAQKVAEVRPKVFVYDMGQNMVGFPQIKIKNGIKGQVITLRYAEITYPNLPEYKGNEGMIMLENIRAALAQDQYILKGGDETIQPRFTFHGYRYLEITGIEQAILVENVKGLVISSVNELASNYETSNQLVNKLRENIEWSLRSNFLSIPTDCPQRNERMGWSGDISVFSRSATYLTDANAFLRKHLMGMRDIQPESGRFTDVAPVGGGFGGTLWGSAGIVVAHETYRQYGDKQMLAEHFPAMMKYINFLETKIDKKTGILNEGPLGDWLSPEGNKNDNTLFWMAYFAYDLDIMSKMAEALGRTGIAESLKARSEAIKQSFNEIYVDKTTHRTVKSGMRTGFMPAPNEADTRGKSDKGVLIDTQASYAIPLALGTFNEENKLFAIKNLSETISRKSKDDGNIERPEYSLMTGFIGTASISEALSENGRDDLAYKLLTNQQYPSWLYSVVNGATSIWERLNSYTVENGFGGNNGMNSFNHYSFGAVAAWMYNYSLGIQRHPQKPAFKEFILKPTPDPTGQITSAKGYYDSVYGKIESEWLITNQTSNIQHQTFTYKCTVPANTTATLYLPANKQIMESGKSVKISKTEGNKVLILLQSGSYEFEIR
jgi:alpha-L-rhamnosidase